jgi:hypothetical protein
MADIITIENNVGNNVYAQTAREFLTSPIETDMVRVLIDNEEQLNYNLKIKNYRSTGRESNRELPLRNYISASKSTTNLIVDIKIDPPVILDGQTYFEVTLAPSTQMNLMFYFDQVYLESLLV